MSEEQPIKEGFERHHRRKGDRSDNRPVNILYLTPEDHKWAEEHPDEARELGWSVSRYEDPEDIPVTIPKAIHKPRAKREKKEKARNRVNVQIRVPKDAQEDGAGLLDELIQQARERLIPEMGWDDDVPAYYVIHAALTDWLNS